jgi:hypothetical protein
VKQQEQRETINDIVLIYNMCFSRDKEIKKEKGNQMLSFYSLLGSVRGVMKSVVPAFWTRGDVP